MLENLIILACLVVPAEASESTGVTTGGSLAAEVLVPLDGFGSDSVGWGAGLSLLSEFEYLAVEPRIAFHHGPENASGYFWNLVADIGVAYLPLQLDVTPFIGVGGGLRWLYWSSPMRTERYGTVIEATIETADTYSELGGGGYVRAGMLFFRSSKMRLRLVAEWSFGFLPGRKPQAVVISVGGVL